MFVVFYRTTDVFAAEEILTEKKIPVEVVQTPVQDKAYCGVCVEVPNDAVDEVKELLSSILEYQLVGTGGGKCEL